MQNDTLDIQNISTVPTDTVIAKPVFWTERKIGIFCGVLSGILWGLDTVLLNESYGYDPLNGDWDTIVTGVVTTFIHDMLSAGMLWVLVIVLRMFSEIKDAFTTRGLLWMILASIFGAPIGMLGYLLAIGYIGASYTAAISSLYPAVGAFLAFVFLKDRLLALGWVGLTLAILGTIGTSITAIVQGGSDISSPGLGVVFALMCVIGWGVECVIADHSFRFYPMDCTAALVIRQTISLIVYGAIIVNAIGSDAHTLIREVFEKDALRWVFGASICGTTSYLFYYSAINKLGATQAIALNITYAIWTIIFGLIFRVYPDNAPVIIVCIIVIAIGSFCCSGLGKEPCPFILLKSWFNLASDEEIQQMTDERRAIADEAARVKEERGERERTAPFQSLPTSEPSSPFGDDENIDPLRLRVTSSQHTNVELANV